MKSFLSLLLFAMLPFGNMIHAQASVYMMITDSDAVTNVRSAPNGKVVMTLPDTCSYMLTLTEPSNGWWRVEDIECAENATDIALQGSPTGKYWIHHSVVGASTRNYGNQRWCLRAKPSKKSKATYWFTGEIVVHPLKMSGEWIKVTINGHTGWIQSEMLCDNPLTTCP